MSTEYFSDRAIAKQAEVERKAAAGEPITTDDMLGYLEPRNPDEHRYGLCPQQLQGRTSDNRPFYFRHRHGEWALTVGPVGANPNYLEWANDGEHIASADGDPTCDEIDQIVTTHLGKGWTAAR